MSFLGSVIIPNSPKTGGTSTGGSFLKSVVLPTDQNQANKEAQLASEAQVSKQQSDYANSFSGIAKATATDIGTKLLNIPKDFATSLWNTYNTTPDKLKEDVQAGASDMQTGGTPSEQALGFGKGVAKTAVRTAGDAAIAVFAPLSSAIGAVLKATGGQPIIDKAGQVVADSSGITDVPAFQKFAMAHPNAGEDFNRLLTLAMSAGEKGKIDPMRIADESKTVATKLVGDSKIVPTSEPVITPTPISQVKGGFIESVVKPETPVETTSPVAEQAPNTRAITLEESAIAKKLTDSLGDLPTHDKMNMEDQAKRSMDYISSNPSEAKQIAMGDSLAPSGVLPESIYTAMEVKAIREGDVQTLRDLAQSKIPTHAGQSLKALDSSDPNSPVKIMRDIQAEREASIEKQTGKKVSKVKNSVANDIKTEIKKVAPTKQSWSDFVETIKCNY